MPNGAKDRRRDDGLLRVGVDVSLTAELVLGERRRVRFKRSAPAILIVTVITLILAVTAISNYLTTHLLESSKAGNFKLMREILSSVQKSTEDRALVRAELIASMSSVRAAFIARDRDKVRAECDGMFRVQAEKYDMDQAQFHVPPGVSFLRLHKPDAFGDDQTSYRPMLADVHVNKALRKGIAVSKAGPAITGIVPIADDAGTHVGSFEVGLEFEAMLDKIKQAYGLEAAAFLDEKVLREVATDLPGAALAPNKRVGKYIRYHATHAELVASLIGDRDIDVTTPLSYERSVSGTLWGVQLVPMYNYAGKQVGVFALADNFADEQAAAGRSRVWLVLASTFACVLMAGMILIVIRGALTAPLGALNARMAALAGGDASQPADPAEAYCEELRTLAASYERLRTEKLP